MYTSFKNKKYDPLAPPASPAEMAGEDTIARRILERMVELTVQDWPQFKDSDPADVLWRIITGQRGISSLEVAVVASSSYRKAARVPRPSGRG